MWRLGTLLVVAVVFRFTSSAQFQYGGEVQRLKRSPPYCPPYFYHQHPRHFPPPPPFWPPPPPYYQEQQNYQGQQNYQEPQNFQEQQSFQEHQNGNQLQPNQQPTFQNEHSQAYSDASSQAKTQNGPGEIAIPEKAPCDKCDKGQNTAVSNAKSVTGSAVAVAIAGKGNKR